MITNNILAPNASSTPKTSSSSSSSSPVSSQTTDSNMFMTLLVAQLKNQDPMEPQDGTAFVAQLAQFNSLDNLISIKQSMQQLVDALGANRA